MRPLVVLDVDYVRQSFVLVLANIGEAIAFEPRVQFSHGLPVPQGAHPIPKLPLWHRLTMLRPGRSIEVFVNTAPAVLSGQGPTDFVAIVSYRDEGRKEFTHRYSHDLTAYRDLPQLGC